jgi:hypothetical protein
MRKYPNPREYIEQRLQELARRDAERLQQAGIPLNETLSHALSERAAQEITESYIQEIDDILDHNIKQIVQEEQRRIRQLRQRRTRIAYLIFAPLALLLGVLAGYSFGLQVPVMGIVSSAGAVGAMATLRLLSTW